MNKLKFLITQFCFFGLLTYLTFYLLTHLSADTESIIYGFESQHLPSIEKQNALLLFFEWVTQIGHGNLGISQYHKIPVIKLIKPALFLSLQLISLALFLTLLLTTLIFSGFLILGQSKQIYLLKSLNLLITIPNYIITLSFILIFCFLLPIFPLVQANGNALFLPAFSIATYQAIILSKLMIHHYHIEIQKHYPMTSKAKGNPESITITKHILKNSLSPLANHFTILIHYLLSSTLLVEIIFNLKGINYVLYHAAQTRDTPVLMVCILIFYLIITFIQASTLYTFKNFQATILNK